MEYEPPDADHAKLKQLQTEEVAVRLPVGTARAAEQAVCFCKANRTSLGLQLLELGMVGAPWLAFPR